MPRHRKSRRVLRHNRRSDTRRVVGGGVVGSGGYGCVFAPALRCEGKDPFQRYGSQYVSKLMKRRHARSELLAARNTRRLLSDVKSASQYFVMPLPFSCKPAPLTGNDIVEYDAQCAGTAAGDNAAEVNANRDELALIFAKNAGTELAVFWASRWPRMPEASRMAAGSQVCRALSSLLSKGITSLNEGGVLHLDIKPENVVVQIPHRYPGPLARLIDWGIAAKTADAADFIASIPSYMYNMPPSQWLMNVDVVNDALDTALEVGGDHKAVCRAASRIIYDRNVEGGEGHLGTVRTFLRACQGEGDIRAFVIEYNTAVLQKYLSPFQRRYSLADRDRYYNGVFSKNIDVWGLLMCLGDLAASSRDLGGDIVRGARRVLSEYCFTQMYSTRPYPIRRLSGDIRSVGS